MKHQHDDEHNPVMDSMLEETLGGRTPPDLSARIVRATSLTGAAAKGIAAGTHESPQSSGKPASTRAATLRVLQRRHRIGIAVAAASVVAGMALIWSPWEDAWTPPTKAPRMVALSNITRGTNAVVESMENEAALRKGWALLETGSPPMRIGDDRVERVSGKVLVKAGAAPTERDIQIMIDDLKVQNSGSSRLTEKEIATMKNHKLWKTAAGASMVALVGTAAFNGATICAEEGIKVESSSTSVKTASIGVGVKVVGDIVMTHGMTAEFFATVDADKNNLVTRAELEAHAKITANGKSLFEILDANGDGNLTAEEFSARQGKGEIVEVSGKSECEAAAQAIELAFTQYDKNKDGFISKDELGDEDLGVFAGMFDTADTDKDGKLSKDECIAAATELSKTVVKVGRVVAESMAPKFEDVDTNKDGSLNADEITADALKGLDADADGVVSKEEWEDGAAELKICAVKEANTDHVMSVTTAKKLLEIFDTDKDGFLTITELGDADSNGSLNADEFKASAQKVAGDLGMAAVGALGGLGGDMAKQLKDMMDGMIAEAAAQAFKKIDTDSNGALSIAELGDANNDGKIDSNEVKTAAIGGFNAEAGGGAKLKVGARVILPEPEEENDKDDDKDGEDSED